MRIFINNLLVLFLLFAYQVSFADSVLVSNMERKTMNKVWKLLKYNKGEDAPAKYLVVYQPVSVADGLCFTKARRVLVKEIDDIDSYSFENEDADYYMNNFFSLSKNSSCDRLDFDSDFFRVKNLLDSVRIKEISQFVASLDFLQNDLAVKKIHISEIELVYVKKNNDFNYSISFKGVKGEPYIDLIIHPLKDGFEVVEKISRMQ